MTTEAYEGPAGVHFNPDELLIIWKALSLIPDAENGPLRRRIKKFLEAGNYIEKQEVGA